MGHDVLLQNLQSAWWIAMAAFLSPFLADFTNKKIPDVVWLLVFGVLIGPHLLGLAQDTQAIGFLRELGLGVLFFIAGMEINLSDLKDPAGKHAKATWFICLLLGVTLAYFAGNHDWKTAIALGIALTSTALGAILPILKESGRLHLPIGQAALRNGALGELNPIIAMTLFLSARGSFSSMLILLAFTVVSILVVTFPIQIIRKSPRLSQVMENGLHATTQSALRFAVGLLLTLMLVSAILHLDVVLGAFASGLFANRILSDEGAHFFIQKLETLGFSFVIPLFFITSGMRIDAILVLHHLPRLVLVVLGLFVIRVMPVFLGEFLKTSALKSCARIHNDKIRESELEEKLSSGPVDFNKGEGDTLPVGKEEQAPSIEGVTFEHIGNGEIRVQYEEESNKKKPQYVSEEFSWQEKLALGFYAGTGLPIIVAVTEVALASNLISEKSSSILVAGGVCTVLLFPLLADILLSQKEKGASRQ